MPFTAQELEEMRLADEEIEREFCQTQEEIEASRRRDRRAEFEALPIEKRKVAASQKARYEANREKVAASQSWIRTARITAGYTQKTIAELLCVSAASVSYLESGRMKLESFAKREYLEELLR